MKFTKWLKKVWDSVTHAFTNLLNWLGFSTRKQKQPAHKKGQQPLVGNHGKFDPNQDLRIKKLILQGDPNLQRVFEGLATFTKEDLNKPTKSLAHPALVEFSKNQPAVKKVHGFDAAGVKQPKAARANPSLNHTIVEAVQAEIITQAAPLAVGTQQYVKALQGYRGILNQFLKKKVAEGASPYEIVKIIKTISIIDTYINDMSEVIEVMHRYHDVYKFPNHYGLDTVKQGQFDYSQRVDMIIDRKIAEWKNSNPREVYVVGGYRSKISNNFGHAAYFTIIKKGNDYYRIDYNAGDEAAKVPGQPGKVYSVDARKINLQGQDIETVMREMMLVAYEKRLRQCSPQSYRHLERLHAELEARYFPETNRDRQLSRISKSQGKDNCTTRSVREMIRNIFPETLFNELTDFRNGLASPKDAHKLSAMRP